MKVRVGDMVKQSYRGGHFFGFVIEIESTLDGRRVATLWRPELPASQQIQTWPLDSHYEIEVIK